MKKISLIGDQEVTWMGARVEVEVGSGKVYSEFFHVFEEVPGFRTKKAKIRDKYIDLCTPVLGEGKAKD